MNSIFIRQIFLKFNCCLNETKKPTDLLFKHKRRTRTNSLDHTRLDFRCTMDIATYLRRFSVGTRYSHRDVDFALAAFTVGHTTLYSEFNISFVIIAINVVSQARGNAVIFIFCFLLLLLLLFTADFIALYLPGYS